MDQNDSVITNIDQIKRASTSAINRGYKKSEGSRDDITSGPTVSSTEQPENKQSKRPKNTLLKQQRLPAWQPILTAKTVLPLFFSIGVIFVILGGILLHFSNIVNEFVYDYTDCNSIDTNTPCSKLVNHTTTCYCEISFKLDEDFEAPVYVYYGLKNFYQNHRRYVKSRDDNQLLGKSYTSLNSECKPYDEQTVDGVKKFIAPCGAIANSLFNDSFEINYTGVANISPAIQINLLRTGIAWNTDKDVKFKNPENNFINTIKPINWKKNVTELDPDDPSNNGFKNEDLIVWMRTAALPNFRKLYRRVDHTKIAFNSSLPKGYYKIKINYNYPVTSFDGRKTFIISTTTWIGGKNPFLGIAYLVVGSLCIVLGFVFLAIHFKFARNLKSSDDLYQSNMASSSRNNISVIEASESQQF